MSPTILLTGGTGQLGSQLGRAFLERGCRVIYLARSARDRSGRDRVIGTLSQLDPDCARRCADRIEVWDGDVTQLHLGQGPDTLRAWRGRIDQLWHSAAILHFRDTYEDITEAINVNGTVKVLDAAHELAIPRFHHISTAYVSGTTPGTAFESQETHAYDFRNPYERTKYNAEIEVRRKSTEYNLATTIYRPAVIVGDSITGKSLAFSGLYNIAKVFYMIRRTLLRRLKDNPDRFRGAGIFIDGDVLHFPLRFPCATNATVNVVPIDYVVATMIQLADRPEAAGQTFHITNSHPPMVADLLLQGCRMLKLEGIQFVSCSFDHALHLIRDQIDHYASMGLNISFCLEIREYIHYFFGEPAFDLANVRSTLQADFAEAPRITLPFLKLLLGYASDHQWRDSLA